MAEPTDPTSDQSNDKPDPRDTEHPAGDEHADTNSDNEPAG